MKNGENMPRQIILLLDDDQIQEVFEILCQIPFEQPSSWDLEPPTKRQAGIEQILDQLEKRIVDKELSCQ